MDFEALSEKLAEENQRLRREVDFLRELMADYVKSHPEAGEPLAEAGGRG